MVPGIRFKQIREKAEGQGPDGRDEGKYGGTYGEGER
jgi:hypothetical protein